MFSLTIPEKKSKSIYGVLRQMYFYARTMGLLQFSANVNEKSDRQMYLTNMDWFIFGVQLAVVSIFTILSMTLDSFNHSNSNKSSLLSLGSSILMRSGMVSYCVFLIFNLLNRLRIWTIFQRIDEFDMEIKSMGTAINYSKHKTNTGIFVKTQMFIWLLFIVFTAYSCRNFIGIIFVLGFFLSYVIVNAGFGALFGLFTFLLLNIKSRFKKLNENLCLITPINGKIKIINTSQDDAVAHIMQLSQLHDKLNDIIETVNFCYSFQVMVLVAGSFVFTIVTLFSLYKAWSSTGETSFAVELAGMHTVWSTYYNVYVTAVLWAGSTMRNEGQRTGLLLHNYINNCNNTDVVDRVGEEECIGMYILTEMLIIFNLITHVKLMLFSQQLKHRVPEASCKLFAFDWTLLFSIVGATGSYLTILIQFDSTSLIALEKNLTINQNVSLIQ